MRKAPWIVLAVLLGAGAGVARAGDITFNVSGSLEVGSPSGSSCPSLCTLGGALTVNNVTGAFISADITMSGGVPNYGPFTIYSNPDPSGFYGYTFLFLSDSDSDVLEILISTPTPGSWAGFDGGSIVPYIVDPTGNRDYSAICPPPGCVGGGSGHYVITSGSLTPAATPEPASFLLFGMSLLGLVPFRRKLFGR
jgi:PEP-CTERM motif